MCGTFSVAHPQVPPDAENYLFLYISIFAVCGKAVFAKTEALSAIPAPYHVFVGVRLLSACLGVVSR